MDGDAVSREIKVRAVCIFLVLMGEGIIWSDCTDKNACRGITLHAPKKIPLGDGCASCGGSSFEKTKEKLYANLHRVFLFPVHLTQVGIFAIFLYAPLPLFPVLLFLSLRRILLPKLFGNQFDHLLFQIYVKGQLTDKGEELKKLTVAVLIAPA